VTVKIYDTFVFKGNVYNILVGKPERKDHSEDLGVDGRIILQ
jgi:hypothetical protein